MKGVPKSRLSLRLILETITRPGYFAAYVLGDDRTYWVDAAPTRAEVKGPFAIYCTPKTRADKTQPRTYRITHIPTGFAVSGKTHRDYPLAIAVGVVNRLLGVAKIDWYDASAVRAAMIGNNHLRNVCSAIADLREPAK